MNDCLASGLCLCEVRLLVTPHLAAIALSLMYIPGIVPKWVARSSSYVFDGSRLWLLYDSSMLHESDACTRKRATDESEAHKELRQ